MGVTVGRFNFEHTVLNLKNRDIESTTSKIVDSNDGIGSLLETISEGGGSRLVYDTEDVQTSNLTSVFGSLTLRVVEVGGYSDNSVLNVLAHVGLGGLLHLSKDETTDLGWRVLLALGLEPRIAIGVLDNLVWHLLNVALDLGVGELATDETLCGKESILRVDDCLALCSDTNQTLAILCETND